MKVSLSRLSSVTLLAFMVVGTIAGCAQIRKLTYPPDFVYLEKKEVDSLMRAMSNSIMRLDQLIAEAETSDTVQQQKIIAELSRLESIATRVGGGYTETNHPVISEHIEQFSGDIGRAKMFASVSPPNYYNAGKITGSCQACHQFR